MNEQELRQAIKQTKQEIYLIKEQMASIKEPEAIKHLKRQLRELQNKQLWHIGKLG